MSDPGSAPPPPRRGGLDPRTAIWVIAGVALVIVLVRSHRVHTYSLLILLALIPSVILHEVSHGAVALAFGDDTAKRAGRLGQLALADARRLAMRGRDGGTFLVYPVGKHAALPLPVFKPICV